MHPGHTAGAGGRVCCGAKTVVVSSAHEHLEVVISPGGGWSARLRGQQGAVHGAASEDQPPQSVGIRRRWHGSWRSEQLECSQVHCAVQKLTGRPRRPGCRAAAPGGHFSTSFVGVSEAGLMRDSSPSSCRHSPGPTLLQPAGSAGAVVSRLMFPQFRCPGRLSAIVAAARRQAASKEREKNVTLAADKSLSLNSQHLNTDVRGGRSACSLRA